MKMDRIEFTRSLYNINDYHILNNFDRIMSMYDLVNIQSTNINISISPYDRNIIFNVETDNIEQFKNFISMINVSNYGIKHDILFNQIDHNKINILL